MPFVVLKTELKFINKVVFVFLAWGRKQTAQISLKKDWVWTGAGAGAGAGVVSVVKNICCSCTGPGTDTQR